MERQPRVLFVTHDFPPSIYGGTGIYAYNFIRTLKKLLEDKVIIEVLSEKDRLYNMSGFENLEIQKHEINLKFNRYPIRNFEFAIKANNFVKCASSNTTACTVGNNSATPDSRMFTSAKKRWWLMTTTSAAMASLRAWLT